MLLSRLLGTPCILLRALSSSPHSAADTISLTSPNNACSHMTALVSTQACMQSLPNVHMLCVRSMQGRAEKVYAKNSKQQAYLHPDERDEVQEEWLGGLPSRRESVGTKAKAPSATVATTPSSNRRCRTILSCKCMA